MRQFLRWNITVIGFLILVVAAMFVSCAPTEQPEEATTTTTERPFGNADYNDLIRNPDDFVGRRGIIYGQVFNIFEDEESTFIQIWTDLDLDNQFVLNVESSRGFTDGDSVRADGEFAGIETYINIFGAEIEAPFMDTERLEKHDPLETVSFMAAPTKTVEVNQIINQQGFAVTLTKIEFTENHTLVYLRAVNGTSDTVSLFTFTAVAIQGPRQFETQFVFLNVPEIPSDIFPGVEAEGVVFFEPLDVNLGQARFNFQAFSESIFVDIEPFVFDVTW